MRFYTLTVAMTVVALSGSACADQTKPATKAATAEPAEAAKATASTTMGTVGRFDVASNTLTVTTPKGDAIFTVDLETTNITADGEKVAASALTSHVGHQVTVQYAESGGEKTAQSVSVTMAGATKKS